MKLLSSLAAIAAFALVVPALSTVAAHGDELSVAAAGKTKINLAGRQRMLSQRMAKAACFASLGVDEARHLAMLGDAHGLFETTLTGLVDGDVSVGMLPETHSAVVDQLGKVERLWAGYGSVIEEVVAAQTVGEDQLAAIAALNVPVLREMHVSVGVMETYYGSDGSVHPALALAINVSGRQRMLSQRASKEFCFIVAGVDVDQNRQALSQTLQLFEDSLEGLINGDMSRGLAPAPTPEIAAQLASVEGLWTPFSAVLRQAAAGESPSAGDIALVAQQNDVVLAEMNAAVTLYNGL